MNILDKLKINHRPSAGALDLLKYIGPGLLVTVGFIDPGNWATNLAAGSEFGYALLWVVTFSSIMLIIIQHNVAHLGIVTGLCLSEATNKYMPRVLSRPILPMAGMPAGGFIVLGVLCAVWRTLAKKQKDYLTSEARGLMAVYRQREGEPQDEQ